MDCSLPSFSVHGMSPAKLLEWVAISFSRGSSWPRDRTHVSCVGRWILYHWATREAYRSLIQPEDSILWQLNWWGEEDCVWEVEYLSGGQGKRKRHLDRCNSLHRVDVQTGIECWLTTRPRGWTGLQENWVDSNWGPWILSWWTMFPKPESICLECKVVEEREIHELRGKDW